MYHRHFYYNLGTTTSFFFSHFGPRDSPSVDGSTVGCERATDRASPAGPSGPSPRREPSSSGHLLRLQLAAVVHPQPTLERVFPANQPPVPSPLTFLQLLFHQPESAQISVLRD